MLTHTETKQVSFVYGDITNPSLVRETGTMVDLTNKVDVVYHMAALLSFDEDRKEETFHVNVEGTRHVLEFSKQIQVKKLIYVSTAYTVGMDVVGHEQLYSTNRDYVNYYEQSKAAAEQLVFSYKNDFEVMIMRPAIIIGDSKTGEADTNFALYGLLKGVRIVKRMVGSDKPFRLLLDGETNSNLVPVDYVADVLSCAIEHGAHETIYNITNNHPLQNKVMLEIIKKALDFPNLEIASKDLLHTLTKEELILHERLRVFENYLSRSIQFESRNTSDLLKAANIAELDLDKDLLEHMITSYLKPNLVLQ
ncbi:SDR family oxidoreductase [Halalkalibacter akibai]|nr:SDR family oxidoreductase [Halalkalibacter akibai]